MTNKTILLLFITFLFYTSCDTKTPPVHNFETSTNKNKNIQTEHIQTKSKELFFLKSVKTKEVPFRDTTNFDNYVRTNTLTSKQLDSLNIKWKSKYDEDCIASINYKLNLSPNFYTIVICNESASELTTSLINYDKEFNIIDQLVIAYDEIAESWLRTESEIKTNKIIVLSYNYADSDTPKIDKSVYQIDKIGKIIKAN